MTTGAQLLIQGRSHLTAVSIIISHLVTFLILYPDKIVTLHQLSASIAVTLVTSRQQIWSWHRIFVSKTDIDISCLNLVKWSNQCRISTSFVFVCSWKEQFLGRVTQRSQSGWPAPKTRAAGGWGETKSVMTWVYLHYCCILSVGPAAINLQVMCPCAMSDGVRSLF